MRKHAIISQMEDELGVLTWPAGSRYTVNPEPMHSDFDWLVFVPNYDRAAAWFTTAGFAKPDDNFSAASGDPDIGSEPWIMFDGIDKINLIVLTSMTAVNDWLVSRDYCKAHNIQSRKIRIAVHRHFRCGDPMPDLEFEPATPSLDKLNEIN